MDRLAAVESFVRVAETRSFTEAAERLRTSKSGVSRQISALEMELGARLLHRTTRSLTLTEAGRSYYERAVRILADFEEANAAVSQHQASPRGHLRISAPMSFGFLHLAPALPDFLDRYPEVSVDLAMNDRFVDLVEEGFDLAVRISALADSSLISRRLAPIKRVLCASPEYLARRGHPRTPDDLKDHNGLRNTNISPSAEWRVMAPDGREWSIEMEGRVAANNGDALRAAALRGLGIASLPTFIVGGDLQAGTLVSLLTEYLPGDLTLHAVYPAARHLSPKVRAFVDFLADRFGPRPYWDLVE